MKGFKEAFCLKSLVFAHTQIYTFEYKYYLFLRYYENKCRFIKYNNKIDISFKLIYLSDKINVANLIYW